MTYEATVEGITALDGVSVDVTVRGNEEKAEKVMMDLKERVGILGAAYDKQTPPDQLDEVPVDYIPIMTVAWDQVFEVEQ